MRSKYGNVKTEVDGIRFDSKREAIYYQELKLRKMAKEVSHYVLQPRFVLQDGFKSSVTGKAVRKLEYVADFLEFRSNGEVVIVDVKGRKTRDFTIKYKIMLFQMEYRQWQGLFQWVIDHDERASELLGKAKKFTFELP